MVPLHPLFVHFPIALLSLGFCADALALWRKTASAERVGWWNMMAGTAGLLAAALSGLASKDRAGMLTPAAIETLSSHEQLAFVTIVCFMLLLYWRIRHKTAIPPSLPGLYLLFLGASLALLWSTAWLGGELVYLFGVGVSSSP
jgi:uncharacterized membrane protein